MAGFNLLNLLAVSSLAILASSFNALPAVNALGINEHHVARSHHNVAKRLAEPSVSRKRELSKRCKARPPPASASQHVAATSTTAPDASITSHAAASTQAHDDAKPSSSKAAPPPAVSVSVSTSSSTSGCKVGLAWSNHEADLIPQFKTSKVCWIYDWTESLEYGMVTDGMNFIPMLWGAKNEAAFKSKVVKGYAKYAAGMNEPDISSQSNLSPSAGAQMWKTYLAPLHNEGYQLLSPATAAGPSWLSQFVDACNGGCEWDFTAVHVYTTTIGNFQNAVSAYQQFNKPVMVTEYSCHDYSGNNQQCSSDQIWSFMEQTQGWMNSQDWIAAFFFFAPMTASELESNNINGANALISNGGNGLTALGQYYINN